jgi:hypothetical protein
VCRRSGVYAWPYGDQDGGLYPQTDEEADAGEGSNGGRGNPGEETRLRRLGTVVGYRTVNGGRMGSAPNSKGFAKVQWDVDICTPERLAAAEGRVEVLKRVKGVQDAMSPIEVTVCKSNKKWDLLVEAKLEEALAYVVQLAGPGVIRLYRIGAARLCVLEFPGPEREDLEVDLSVAGGGGGRREGGGKKKGGGMTGGGGMVEAGGGEPMGEGEGDGGEEAGGEEGTWEAGEGGAAGEQEQWEGEQWDEGEGGGAAWEEKAAGDEG